MNKFTKISKVITAAAVAASAITSASVGVFASNDYTGKADTSWYNENDTEFVLDTPEELAGLALLVNEGTDDFSGKTVSLGDNITFFRFADPQAWADGVLVPENLWVPIGNTYGTPFKGTFDGCGYAVSGLCTIEFNNAAGLFGYAGSGSEIENLTIENSYIYSNGTYSGGICAYNHLADIRNCYSNGNIICSDYYISGGICGVNAGGNVVSSSSASKVTGGNSAGGIAGEQCIYGRISGCFSSGSVGSANAAGGISGKCGDNTIRNCYNTGSVFGRKISGGISGQTAGDSELQNCYSSGAVSSETGIAGGITGDSDTVCINCYYLDSTADSGCAGSGTEAVSAAALTDGSLAAALGDGFIQGESFPVLGWQDNITKTETSTTPTTTTSAATTTTNSATTASASTTITTVTTTVKTISVSSKPSVTQTTTVSDIKIKIWAVNNDTTLECPGDTVQLLIDGNVNTPNWATMDSAVATVNEYGLVTAKGQGTVTIVAMVDGVAAEITLTVGAAETTTATTTAETASTTTTTTENLDYCTGDCDGNQNVDLEDAATTLKYYACLAASLKASFSDDADINTLAMEAADVTHDGAVDLSDASSILKYYSQKAAGLPAEWE